MRKLLLLALISIQLYAQKIELLDSRELSGGAVALSNNILNSIFVIDELKNELLQFDINLNLINSTGGFGSGFDNFDYPSDISCSALNVYVTDKNNSRIQAFDKDLNFLFTFELAGEKLNEKIYYPQSCAVSSSGDYFVLDTENNRVVKFNSKGSYLLQFGDYESGIYQIENPLRVLTNEIDKIFVIQKNAVNVYDFFGSGITKLKFDYEIISASISFNQLVITNRSKISIINFDNANNSIDIDLSSILPNEDFKHAIIINNFIYALTSKKIYKIKFLK